MDQYNVITPTNNLDDLDRDMNNWYLLPFEMRMRSNDECMRRNGCTIQDYYNRMRTSIIKHQDQGEYKPNNLEIMKENAYSDLLSDVNFSEKKAMSNDYNQSPFIVIIDPDVKDIDELSRLYDSYLLLSPRNRLLSNEYSYSIWGYNVQNMRDLLMGKFETTSTPYVSDNIIKESLTEGNVIKFAADRYNHWYWNNQIIELNAVAEYGTLLDDLARQHFTSSIGDVSAILPTVTPYFTAAEIRDRGYKINIPKDKSYIKALKEAKTEEEFLALGWNPSISINEKTIKFAKERQLKSISNTRIVDVSEMKMLESGVIDEVTKDSYPFITVRDGDSYYAVGNESFNKLVSLNKNPGKSIYRDELGDRIVEVAVIGVDKYTARQFKKADESLYNPEGVNFNGIYEVLKHPLNKFDLDVRKVYYAEMAELLYEYFNAADTDKKFVLNENNTFKIVYKGSINSTKLKINEVLEKFNAIKSDATMEKILTEKYYMGSDNIAENSVKNFIKKGVFPNVAFTAVDKEEE